MIQNKLTIWLMLLLLAACTPKWDDHYEVGQATVTNQTVLEYLQGCPEYAQFVTLLKEAGADTIFSGKTELTVWVPTNDKVPDLSGLSDSLRILTIKNHISMLPYTTVDMQNQIRVTSFSGKKLGIYSDDDVSFRVNDCRLVKTDMICRDGVVHEIGGWLELQPNLKDYLQSSTEYTILQELINARQDTVFDEKNSQPTGEVDAIGRPLYDSVFVYVNRFYNQTKLDRENQLFTLLLTPDWVLQEEIEGYYKAFRGYTGETPTAEDSTKVNTWLTRSIPYSGSYADFAGIDKIYSMYNSVWYPKYHQLGNLMEFSNGLVWQVTDLYIPRSMIFPSDGSGQTYVINDIYTKKAESINVQISGVNPDDPVTDIPVVESSRENGYKITVSPIDASNTEPFNAELSWTLGKTTLSGTFRQITQIPGEYKFEFVFKKSDDLTTDFEIYINGEYVTLVNMKDYKDITDGTLVTITKRVTIRDVYAETPTQISMRAVGGTGTKQVLSVYSVFFQPSANIY